MAEINHLFKVDLKLIIFEEDLYGKQFVCNVKGNQIYKFVENKINSDFMQNGDILYDFQKNNNIITIYYIKGAKRIEKIAEMAVNLEVKPIQFIAKEVMEKFFHNKKFNCNLLVKLQEYYYYMEFKDGLFYGGLVSEERDVVFNRIIQNNKLKEIYLDSGIEEKLFISKDIKSIKVNLEELINEKIYKKQRLYTRKILYKKAD